MPDQNSSSSGSAATQPVRRYRLGRMRRVGNAVSRVFVRAGLLPHTYVLTTRGRKTGRERSNPVTLVEHDGRRWLVAPYGPVSWVLNARAAGRVRLTRRGTTVECTIRELPAEQAGPILKEYVHIARVTRPYFRAGPDAAAKDFAAEAGLHPVFELERLDAR